MILLEDTAGNQRIGTALERAVVQSAIETEGIARSCRGVVIKHWRSILKTIQAGGSQAAVKSKVNDAIRAATSEIVAQMDRGFERLAEQSAELVDKAVFEALSKRQASLVEDDAEDYLKIRSPEGEWPAGRPIQPLPPEPSPGGAKWQPSNKRKPTKATNLKIIKAGKYRERMDKWSKQITNKAKVAEIIAAGVAKGDSLQDIAKRVEPHVRNLSSSAMRIVRTEAARIHNEVAELNYANYDSITAGYRVINPLDERTRPSHRQRASETNANGLVGRIYWKPEHAPKGAKYFVADRPPLPDEPNCRCSYVPVLIDDAEAAKKKRKGQVDDIEHDVDEETLEKHRAAEREKSGQKEKKERAGVRDPAGQPGKNAELNAKLIGTKEWHAARQQILAQRKAAEEKAAAEAAKEAKRERLSEDAWIKSLSKDEATAMYRWTRNMYAPIRQFEATGKVTGWPQQEIEETLPHLYSALERGEIHQGDIHRGLTNLSRTEAASYAQKGAILRFDATTAFSSNRAVAREFAKQIPNKIKRSVLFTVKNNKTGVRIARASSKPNEMEVLVKKGAQYRVVASKETKDKYGFITINVELEEM